MTNPCAPAETAEDRSLHWVEHFTHGKRVWAWRPQVFHGKDGWSDGNATTEVRYLKANGWRYVGPASPDDASELAKARAQIAALQAANAIFKQRGWVS